MGESASARPNFDTDCGINMRGVRAVLQRKFPQLGLDFIRDYIGTWVYPGYAPMEISNGRPFRAMGHELYICPRNDRSFLVYWKSDSSLAGTLKMSGQNRVTIYGTTYGNIPLDRQGTATADND